MPTRLACLLPVCALSLAAAPLPEGWEVRFLLKVSTPQDRPRWEAKWHPAAGDERAHLSLTQTGPAAGGVMVGRRLRLPENPAELELSAVFQTFCAMANRSGAVDLGVLSPAVWSALGREPEKATPPPDGADWLVRRGIHPNREDVLAWRTGRVRGQDLAPLAAHAGEEVVLAVLWSTWHPTSEEWFRLADLRLGEPRPWLRPIAWPRSARADADLELLVEAWAPETPRVELGWRAEGGDWQWLPMAAVKDREYRASIAGTALGGPIECQARLMLSQGEAVNSEPQTIVPRQPRVHPCVFYSPAMLGQMRRRIAGEEWARETAAGIQRNADAWKERTDEPPTGPGGWSHDYACPKDGARLRFREDHPHDHLCPRCGKEWQGEKLDANWRNTIHGRLIGAARDCALTAHLRDDPSYAAFPRRILAWYAEHYREFPEGRGPAGKGRVMSQSLSECSWLLSAMEAADLAFPFLAPDERRAVETGFLEPGVAQISKFQFGIHNIQCWHNACMACAGYFLGDDEWVRRGTEGPRGFREQVAKGILEDGLWYERSLGYHNYTVSALVKQCEAARLNGESLHELGRLPLMFTAPLRLSFPNLVSPSLNDQGYQRGRIGTHSLEMAWAWYRDPLAASALRKLYAEGAKRGGLHLLKYGSDLPEGDQYVSPGSVDMPGAGLAILRRGGVEGPCAMVEYGEHGGGHGHPDKLQLIVYGLGQVLCPDIGTTGYGVPLHREWYKTTPGHNTVTIGGNNQRATTGKLLAFHSDERQAAAAVESTGAYPGWRLRRHLLLTDEFLVDVFDVMGEKEDSLDWFLRCVGTATATLPMREDAGEAKNRTYGYLREARSALAVQPWSCQWRTDKGTLHLTMLAEPGTQVALAKAPGPAGEDPWDTLQVRRRATATRFVAIYQFLVPDEAPKEVRATADGVEVGKEPVALPTEQAPLPTLL